MNKNDEKIIMHNFVNGCSVTAINNQTGISFHRIRKILTANGIVINAVHKTILELHQDGMPSKDIALIVGLSESVVQSYLPPLKPLYGINPSYNAIKIKRCRTKKKAKK